MVQEIIYTSAQKGLKQGSRGFCTVVSTAGMAANMAERLESMSGYRHAFPLNDPKVAQNPVNYAHVTTRMAGQKLNVISRVADAGQDYSGRTNKLAHHIVIDDVSVLPVGPARVLADPMVVATTWDGKLETRPPRALSGSDIPETVRLSAWKSVTGDGGWCGYVAEQLIGSRAPVNVIFPPGTDTLSLVREVLDVIPIPQRWGITFSTYFTRLQAGTECQLRFVLDGTNESASLRNDARAIRVDLAKALPAATGGPLVDQARSGTLEFKMNAAPTTARPARRKAVSDEELEGILDSPDGSLAAERTTASDRKLRAVPTTPGASVPPPVSRLNQAFEQKQTGNSKGLFAVLASLLICAIGAGAYFVVPRALKAWGQRQQQLADTTSSLPEATEKKELGPASPPPPFGGKLPFAQLRTEQDTELVFELPDVDDTEPRALGLLLTLDSSSLQIQLDGMSDTESLSSSGKGTWTLMVNENKVASIKGVVSDEGVQLFWSWAEGVVMSDDTRATAYRLQRMDLKFLANEDWEREDAICAKLNVPPLFEGKPPHLDIKTDGDNLALWTLDNKNDTPLFSVYAHSANNLHFSRIDDSIAILAIGNAENKAWEVEVNGMAVGAFNAAYTESAGVTIEWTWKTKDIPSALYALRSERFLLRTTREDSEPVETTLGFRITSPAVFDDSAQKLGEQFFIPLPNPSQQKSLPVSMQPRLQIWNDENVELELHPDYKKLIKNADRGLRLVSNLEAHEWTVQIVDELESTENVANIAKYSLHQPSDRIGEYRLGFEWLGEANRGDTGLALAELLRWCPLIVHVGAEDRAFVQRQPDRWIIPPWDRQKGFTLEQDPTANFDTTGQEFSELNLQTGSDASFRLAYGVPTDTKEVSIIAFEGTLVPRDGHFTHTVKCPIADLAALELWPDENKNRAGDSGLLRTTIHFPDKQSDSPHFMMETVAYVAIDLPRFSKHDVKVPAELQFAQQDNVANWFTGAVKRDGELGLLPLLKANQVVAAQKKRLQRRINDFRRKARNEIAEQNSEITKQQRTKPQGWEGKILEAKANKTDIGIRMASVDEIEVKWLPADPSSSPYTDAEASVKSLTNRLNMVTMQISLGIKLKAPHQVNLIFVEAKMQEPSNDN